MVTKFKISYLIQGKICPKNYRKFKRGPHYSFKSIRNLAFNNCSKLDVLKIYPKTPTLGPSVLRTLTWIPASPYTPTKREKKNSPSVFMIRWIGLGPPFSMWTE